MHATDDMTIFVRIIERGSLSAAGRDLRLSAAVVSARMLKLEARLGVRLLNRTTRNVTPTEEGRLYFEHCQRVLAETADVERRLSEKKAAPSGALRVSAPTMMGRRWIGPLAAAFQKQYPEVEIRLQLTDRLADLVEEGVDVAIRRGFLESSALIARRLAPDFRVACASPEYLARCGAPQRPQDLRAHNCLLLRFPGSRRFQWQFMESGDLSNLAVSGRLDTNNSDMLVDWALAGEGVIMKSVWDVGPDIEAGRLVPLLTRFSPPGLAIHALTPPHRMQPPKTRAFILFLSDQLPKLPPARLAERMRALASSPESSPDDSHNR